MKYLSINIIFMLVLIVSNIYFINFSVEKEVSSYFIIDE